MSSGVHEKKNGEFWRMCFDRQDDGVPMHIRVPPALHLGAFFVGWVRDLHGPDGCCTDCFGRDSTSTREAS